MTRPRLLTEKFVFFCNCKQEIIHLFKFNCNCEKGFCRNCGGLSDCRSECPQTDIVPHEYDCDGEIKKPEEWIKFSDKVNNHLNNCQFSPECFKCKDKFKYGEEMLILFDGTEINQLEYHKNCWKKANDLFSPEKCANCPNIFIGKYCNECYDKREKETVIEVKTETKTETITETITKNCDNCRDNRIGEICQHCYQILVNKNKELLEAQKSQSNQPPAPINDEKTPTKPAEESLTNTSNSEEGKIFGICGTKCYIISISFFLFINLILFVAYLFKRRLIRKNLKYGKKK